MCLLYIVYVVINTETRLHVYPVKISIFQASTCTTSNECSFSITQLILNVCFIICHIYICVSMFLQTVSFKQKFTCFIQASTYTRVCSSSVTHHQTYWTPWEISRFENQTFSLPRTPRLVSILRYFCFGPQAAFPLNVQSSISTQH